MQNAVRRLAERLPELADRLVEEILSGEQHERSAELRGDLWKMCHVGLGHGIEAILNPGGTRTDLRWAEYLGRRRAEQGLPLDQLLRSYRLAGSVFWQGIVEVISEDNPEYVPQLVRHVTNTWQTIDQQSVAAAEAYHRTEYDVLRRGDERVQAVVDALLEGRGADGGLLNTATTVLGLPAHGRYAVVVQGQRGDTALPPHGGPAEARGMRFIWRMRADTVIALVSLGSAGIDELVEVLRSRTRCHTGISPVVEGLADLGRARWLADLALRTCSGPEPELARLDERLPSALVVSQPDLAGYLYQQALGGLTDVEPGYRDILVSTLTAWLDCNGSAGQAARRLYCHRNTVLNRLRRIEALTGRSLASPRDLVELVLALNAFTLRSGLDELSG
ncbi:PucR family transcriptional regulator [Actinomadura craniellae]|uniref:PucR family transcriptional regulator n=2 Tax=Actinomadura craniellae TaxID=2231787 RepID=A0A365GWV7_9ACTN|nr:PucR family transcriptional regulator [Actinomadura craniellae]